MYRYAGTSLCNNSSRCRHFWRILRSSDRSRVPDAWVSRRAEPVVVYLPILRDRGHRFISYTFSLFAIHTVFFPCIRPHFQSHAQELSNNPRTCTTVLNTCTCIVSAVRCNACHCKSLGRISRSLDITPYDPFLNFFAFNDI